ncbi:MAG TPA: cbb3-type cytochrome c oxidase subunit II [Anaeromyxobacter sp.]
MSGAIYKKPILFAVMALAVVLVGTVATMAYPLLRADMHVKVEGLKPLPALELAGRDIYQREGCVGCHTQTVRPLKSEVVRYKGKNAKEPTARYSLAGEFAYDHPFLWGSKRTGPDLAFEGWIKPSVDWQKAHLENPQKLVARSNMPAYAFISKEPVDGEAVAASMRALRRVGVPYTDADVAGAADAVKGKTNMDALVAYVVSLGKAVDRAKKLPARVDLAEANPLGQTPEVVERGHKLFETNGCTACHGDDARGQEGVAPSLVDDEFLGVKGDLPDAAYAAMIQFGSDVKPALGRPGVAVGGMPSNDIDEDDVWAVVSWLRSQKAHEAGEHHQAAEHK